MAKKKKFPWVITTLSALALARGLWRPMRQPLGHAKVQGCENVSSCGAELTLTSTAGTSGVFALASGMLSKGAGGDLYLVPNSEPVVLVYTLTSDANMLVPEGKVGLGQKIATAGAMKFAVYRINQDGSYTPLSPTSWLVSRGLKVADHGVGWCMAGRRITVPSIPGSCGMRLADPPSVALLPVSVQVA